MSVYQRFLSKVFVSFFMFVSTIATAESSASNANFIQGVSEVTAKSHLTLEEKYLADISVHSSQELLDILTRANMLFESGQYSAKKSSPCMVTRRVSYLSSNMQITKR